MNRTVEITYLESWQAGPYKDSVYMAKIKFSSKKPEGFDPDVDTVKKVIKIFVHDFEVDAVMQPVSNIQEPYLKNLIKLDIGEWEAKVVEPYTG
jgi:hypothetical protein